MTKGKYQRRRNNEAHRKQELAKGLNHVSQEAKLETKETEAGRSMNVSSKTRGWKGLVGAVISAVGLVSAFFSFFPHITFSDPVQMDATDVFSSEVTVSNGGLLPIYNVHWALAPRTIKLSPDGSSKAITLLLPHSADWIVGSDLMAASTKPGIERHAAIMMEPGSELTVPGPADYEFHIRAANDSIGTLNPGDEFTVTTEGLLSAPSNASYDTADFAIALTYIPVFPPIPMQTCSHFQTFRDRQGVHHWFRATNQCDRFPWTHGLFSKHAGETGKSK